MAKVIEFLFDVGSPTAYLAWTQLPALAERTGADIVSVPILLGGLFNASKNASPTASAAKTAYIARDCVRYADRYGVPFNLNPHFPVNTIMMMRAIVGATEAGTPEPLVKAAFHAMWIDGDKLDDPNVLEAVAAKADIPVVRLASWIGNDTVKAKLRQNTDQAAARGAFGAPTFFVGDEMFFGQDRLDWVEAAVR